ncbi:TFIIA-alpha and beta-like factor [Xenopus tropicalis]|uniref:TFIIA-alpha and beta-like factor n=1 Tax=Xenopus tropicalis TaxID=8364 RepID=Q28C10_XENTR|nr:TFIIA-alpha and beta-like factor [Xenopus tropicalis]CAJ83735.1 TFIIA-alpha/beta-like factor [Xenopus tropicalis]|eukprot:NP_001039213.1 TFIIA-alpha and beta-like factor [Xenopus tropicalis]
MAHSANPNPVPKLYKSIIEDVMESVRELFVEEGVDEQVLKDLKQLWEIKVLQSKATEGFFRDNSAPQFVLQLPQNLHHSLHSSTGNRNVTHFSTGEMGTSGSNSAFSLPAGITYPIHLPAGMTVQTASGQLYKVTVPVMVTQAPGGPRILQPPVQQFFQHIRHPSGHAASSQYSRNAYIEQKWQQQPAQVHSSEGLNIYDQEATIEPNYQNNNNDDLIIQQSIDLQQNLTNKGLHQPTNSLEGSNLNEITGTLFSPRQSNGGIDLNSESVMNNLNMAHSLQGQPENEYASLLKSQDSDDVVELILMDNELGDKTSTGDSGNVGIQTGISNVEKQAVPREIEIIQVDGTGDTSSDEDLGNVRDLDENDFLGIIDTEDLKALEEDDTASNDSTSNSSDDEDPEIDVIEEDPLNSGDDVSEQEVPDLFDTDNVIVCQYDKIHRSKNKWKFYLKDGVMSFGGKDYVFSKAIGEAEW